MLVKLVLLRERGHKREKAAVLADQGVLADWSCSSQQRRGEAPVLWAWCLVPGGVAEVVRPLKFVTLKQASTRGIVVTGLEVDVDTDRPRHSYRQAWWLRPLPPTPNASPTPSITLLPDIEKVRRQLAVEVQ
ncbi:MAG: hypothetical protein V4451_04740 [Pseudomonadota bacterium]